MRTLTAGSVATLRAAVRPLVITLAGLLLATVLQAQEMQVINLKFRLADEILPIVQPLVEPGGVMTGTDNVLFFRTSERNFAQIQQAVAALDRALRQLLISVGQANTVDGNSADVRGSATVGSGDVQVGINRPPGAEPGAQAQAEARTARANVDTVSSVRALESNEAYIAIGQSAPVTTTQVTPGRYGPNVTQTTGYRDASTGFYATARLSGDRVTLEIAPQQQAFRSRGTIDAQGMTTTVSGRLGEWIPIGAVREQRSGSTSGLLVWSSRSSSSEYSAWVKVDEVR
jgi:type II secretory pathway component GspD/PulD (secretin)